MALQLTFFTDLVEEPVEEPVPNLCRYAVQFKLWADTLCDKHTGAIVDINQAKVLLLDKYYDWKQYVPKPHRKHTGDRGHTCIFHVFEATYKTLRLAELSLNPPLLFLPPAPLPPPQIAGITFGEVVGE